MRGSVDASEWVELLHALKHDLPNGGEQRVVSLTTRQLDLLRSMIEGALAIVGVTDAR